MRALTLLAAVLFATLPGVQTAAQPSKAVDNAALGNAKKKTLSLTPVDSAGAPLVYAKPSSVQVSGFKCQPGTMDPKYLPGSCR